MITITRAENMSVNDLMRVAMTYLDYDMVDRLGLNLKTLEHDVQDFIDAFENSENYLDLIDKVEDNENLSQGDNVEKNILEILDDIDEEDEFDMMYPNGKDDDDE